LGISGFAFSMPRISDPSLGKRQEPAKDDLKNGAEETGPEDRSIDGLLETFGRALSKFGDRLLCSVCRSLFKNAAKLPCGHVFCRNCIVQSLSHQERCPDCRAPSTRRQVTDNESMQRIVRCFQTLHPSRHEQNIDASACSWSPSDLTQPESASQVVAMFQKGYANDGDSSSYESDSSSGSDSSHALVASPSVTVGEDDETLQPQESSSTTCHADVSNALVELVLPNAPSPSNPEGPLSQNSNFSDSAGVSQSLLSATNLSNSPDVKTMQPSLASDRSRSSLTEISLQPNSKCEDGELETPEDQSTTKPVPESYEGVLSVGNYVEIRADWSPGKTLDGGFAMVLDIENEGKVNETVTVRLMIGKLTQKITRRRIIKVIEHDQGRPKRTRTPTKIYNQEMLGEYGLSLDFAGRWQKVPKAISPGQESKRGRQKTQKSRRNSARSQKKVEKRRVSASPSVVVENSVDSGLPKGVLESSRLPKVSKRTACREDSRIKKVAKKSLRNTKTTAEEMTAMCSKPRSEKEAEGRLEETNKPSSSPSFEVIDEANEPIARASTPLKRTVQFVLPEDSVQLDSVLPLPGLQSPLGTPSRNSSLSSTAKKKSALKKSSYQRRSSLTKVVVPGVENKREEAKDDLDKHTKTSRSRKKRNRKESGLLSPDSCLANSSTTVQKKQKSAAKANASRLEAVVLCMGISKEKREGLKELLGADLNGKINTNLRQCEIHPPSHIVIKSDSPASTKTFSSSAERMKKDFMIHRPTLAFFHGIMSGAWIVDDSWIDGCVKSKSWVDPAAFEIEGVTTGKTVLRGGPGRARMARIQSQSTNTAGIANDPIPRTPGLFDGYTFFVHGSMKGPMKRHELESLLRLGDGRAFDMDRVLDKTTNSKHSFILVCNGETLPQHIIDMARNHLLSIVDVDWALDSISNYQIMGVRKYSIDIDQAEAAIQASLSSSRRRRSNRNR
jgi:hypothetical protein